MAIPLIPTLGEYTVSVFLFQIYFLFVHMEETFVCMRKQFFALVDT